ncbi:MAG: hypothetical protein R2697_18215 [Ilumatobacteraceae bacterium]
MMPITSSAAMTVPRVENPVSWTPTSLVVSQPLLPTANRSASFMPQMKAAPTMPPSSYPIRSVTS